MAPRTRQAARLEAEQAAVLRGPPRKAATKSRKRSTKSTATHKSDAPPRKRRRTEVNALRHQPSSPSPSMYLAPILRLPLDIFQEIYLLLSDNAIAHRARDRAPPAFVASQVCRTWRRFAFASPRLWRKFNFEIPRNQQNGLRSNPTPKDMPMSTWIRGAKTYPTSASVIVAPGRQAVSLHPSIIKTILPGVKRLQSLHLSLPLSTYCGLESASENSFKALETLHIHVCSLRDPDAYRAGWNYPIPAFKNSPLKRVTLTSFGDFGLLNQRGLALNLPWSRLTHLTVKEGRVDGEACLGVILQSRNLVSCNMEGVITWEDPIPPSPLVTLPYLEVMDMSFVGDGTAYPFFQSIAMPALKELTMTNISAYCFDAATFATRSCQVIEKFVMHESGLDLRLETLIRRMPTLKYLEIDTNDLYLGVDVYPLLVRSAAVTPHLLPSLETLVITESYMWDAFYDNYEEEEWKDNALAKLIASRFRPLPPTEVLSIQFAHLSTVVINYPHRLVYEDARCLLEACYREGLKLKINDAPREVIPKRTI